MCFGACKVCFEKDKRIITIESQSKITIDLLKSEIEFLRDLARPKPIFNHSFTPTELEASLIMSGNERKIELPADYVEKQKKIQDEANKIFSGTY